MKKVIKNISEKITETFTPQLELFGFKRKSSKVESEIAENIYVKGDLYIKIMVDLNLRDFPYYFNIVLGEGPLSFPECDWNSIPLWRLTDSQSKYKPGYYLITDIDSIDHILTQANADLKKYGSHFLNGELAMFNEARKSQNISREPYKVHIPKKDGGYKTVSDARSRKLKRKYS